MVDNNNENKGRCKITDCHASWVIFILVILVIIGTIAYIVTDCIRAPKVQDIVIQVETTDSIQKGTLIYKSEGIDSLITVVKDYELKLDEKYQYLLENRQDEERFKTWGALIVGVIVSICGFWGYKSLKDLREDITANTEKTAELSVKVYLDKKLQHKVNEELTHSLNSDIVKIIKGQVFDTLNSSEDPIVKAKVAEKIESEEFEKKLNKIVKEKVEEIINKKVLNFNQGIISEKTESQDDEEDIHMT